MQARTKVSVSVDTRLLREAQRVAGSVSRSAMFDQALAHWLRRRRQLELERSIGDYYKSLSTGDAADDAAWAETGDDTVRRVWNEPKR